MLAAGTSEGVRQGSEVVRVETSTQASSQGSRMSMGGSFWGMASGADLMGPMRSASSNVRCARAKSFESQAFARRRPGGRQLLLSCATAQTGGDRSALSMRGRSKSHSIDASAVSSNACTRNSKATTL